jgi:hypothetical protein
MTSELLLASESPMSLAGSAQRAWRLTPYPHGHGWMAAAREATITGVPLLILRLEELLTAVYRQRPSS